MQVGHVAFILTVPTTLSARPQAYAARPRTSGPRGRCPTNLSIVFFLNANSSIARRSVAAVSSALRLHRRRRKKLHHRTLAKQFAAAWRHRCTAASVRRRRASKHAYPWPKLGSSERPSQEAFSPTQCCPLQAQTLVQRGHMCGQRMPRQPDEPLCPLLNETCYDLCRK